MSTRLATNFGSALRADVGTGTEVALMQVGPVSLSMNDGPVVILWSVGWQVTANTLLVGFFLHRDVGITGTLIASYVSVTAPVGNNIVATHVFVDGPPRTPPVSPSTGPNIYTLSVRNFTGGGTTGIVESEMLAMVM